MSNLYEYIKMAVHNIMANKGRSFLTMLGTGLAGVEIKDHIKNSFFWIWGVSIICLISGIILGVIKF